MRGQRIGLLGLGEAGSAFGAGLVAAGLDVVGFDPRQPEPPRGVRVLVSAQDVGRAADVLLSLNAASVAEPLARELSPVLREGQLYADLNAASPGVKARVAAIVEARGAEFVDVALVAPVPGRGVRTPALIAGRGAERFRELFEPLGMPLEVVLGSPGAASARKLLRSVFMKGWAAAVGEALAAAEAAGCADWLYGDIAREMTGADEALLRRLIEGSHRHAARRVDEMQAASDYLHDLGVEPRVAEASRDWLRSLLPNRAARITEAAGARESD